MANNHHLAQINIARALAPLDSPAMAGFMVALDEINTLAEASPGYVWRLQAEDGNATSYRPYDDPMMIVNLTVWESVEALKDYAYKSRHVQFVRRRAEWFESLSQPYLAMWWMAAGEIPTVEEAKARLKHLAEHGPTPRAFNFQQTFEPE